MNTFPNLFSASFVDKKKKKFTIKSEATEVNVSTGYDGFFGPILSNMNTGIK